MALVDASSPWRRVGLAPFGSSKRRGPGAAVTSWSEVRLLAGQRPRGRRQHLLPGRRGLRGPSVACTGGAGLCGCRLPALGDGAGEQRGRRDARGLL